MKITVSDTDKRMAQLLSNKFHYASITEVDEDYFDTTILPWFQESLERVSYTKFYSSCSTAHHVAGNQVRSSLTTNLGLRDINVSFFSLEDLVLFKTTWG